METLNISKKNAQKAYNEGCPDVKKVLENLFGTDVLSQKKITDRVKTFEDACNVLCIDHSVLPFDDPGSKDSASINAYAKLIIICRALNEGWKPDWDNSNEAKWYPYFNMKAGFGFSDSGYGNWHTGTFVGSRLCFKSEELAKYAGKQFELIYKDFLTL